MNIDYLYSDADTGSSIQMTEECLWSFLKDSLSYN